MEIKDRETTYRKACNCPNPGIQYPGIHFRANDDGTVSVDIQTVPRCRRCGAAWVDVAATGPTELGRPGRKPKGQHALDS
jgi:hypothetical protein